jgi:two-component system, cell cycle sensor histidine kinase DivJ
MPRPGAHLNRPFTMTAEFRPAEARCALRPGAFGAARRGLSVRLSDLWDHPDNAAGVCRGRDVLHSVSLLAPVRDYIDALVHPSARRDVLTAARHRAFIAPRLLGGLIALATFPLLWAMRGAPNALEAVALGWLIAPILIACFLSRTGRLEQAHVLSSLALTVLVTMVAAASGGIASFAAIWLVLVPLDAALAASRKVVIIAALFALAAAGLLLMLPAAGLAAMPLLSDDEARTLCALAIGAAALYATGLALGAESMARTGIRLRSAEEARYRLLARNMTDVITRHGRNGTVLFISPAAETLLGVAAQQLRGHGLFDRVHVGDRPAFLTALSDAGAQGADRSVEFRVRREQAAAREPHYVWVEMRCRPLAREAGDTADGGDRQVVSVMRDVSGRKVQEQALAVARAEAERADAGKSRFLATMSHELRTPLNAIIGFSDMLANEQTMNLDPARRRDYAQMINESGQHLLAVVNGILDMSKIEAGNFAVTPEPFALAPAAESCCDLMALRAREAGVDLVVQLPGDLPEVFADRRAVKQILLNLLSNAFKFTDAGGRVTLSAAAEDGLVVLSIADTGIGIGEGDLPRLGDPFFQARSDYDRPRDGAGLGLSIVKGLLDLQNGRMQIASRLGEGTSITVRLPAVREARRPAAIGPARAEATAATSNIRVKKSA